MRLIRQLSSFVLILFAAACDEGFFAGLDDDDPTELAYRIVGGDAPGVPVGVLLTWQPPRGQEPLNYAVYGRAYTAGEWYLVGITTSPTFHDAGPQQRQYYVAARDEEEYEFGRSRTITIETAASLAMPDGLTSITLNRGVQLAWAHNAYQAAPARFESYRVYSTTYGSASGCSSGGWQIEGSTLAPAFLVTGMTNGVTRCFAVTAVARDGSESAMSRTRTDTPRFDARHVIVDAFELAPASSGFLFHDAARSQYGAVVDGARADADFRLERAADGRFWLRTTRAEVRMAKYGTAAVADLGAIDVAPAATYSASLLEALPGHAYVFRIARSDGVRYGAVRVAYLTSTYAVVDWAYQTDPGNPELSVGGLPER